ncbi:MAG: hypothetical protein ACRC9K_24030 [Afipia sp.]
MVDASNCMRLIRARGGSSMERIELALVGNRLIEASLLSPDEKEKLIATLLAEQADAREAIAREQKRRLLAQRQE